MKYEVIKKPRKEIIKKHQLKMGSTLFKLTFGAIIIGIGAAIFIKYGWILAAIGIVIMILSRKLNRE